MATAQKRRSKMRPRGRASCSPIGLDIGARGVRAAQVVRSKNVFTVTGLARTVTTLTASDEEPSGGSVVDRIRSCLAQTRFRGRTATVGLSTPDVEFHALDLPESVVTGSDNPGRVVHLEVQRLSTLPEGTIETGHWPLPATRASAPTVLGVAAKRDVIAGQMARCADAGLVCGRADVAAAALCRFGLLINDWTDEVWGVLDLGERQARLVICVDQTPTIIRAIGSGGQRWTQLLSESLDVSAEAAEFQKVEHGIALDLRAAPRGDKSDVGAELGAMVLNVLRGDLHALAAEVKRSYEYALSCYPACKPGGLVLVGGGAAMRNLPEFLSAELGIEVVCASTLLKRGAHRLQIGVSMIHSLEEFALAIGLAVKE